MCHKPLEEPPAFYDLVLKTLLEWLLIIYRPCWTPGTTLDPLHLAALSNQFLASAALLFH